jgi:hypothetical protein
MDLGKHFLFLVKVFRICLKEWVIIIGYLHIFAHIWEKGHLN